MRLLRKLPWGQEILRRESSVRDAPGPDMAEAEREATQADEAPHRYFDAKTGEWKPKPPVQCFFCAKVAEWVVSPASSDSPHIRQSVCRQCYAKNYRGGFTVVERYPDEHRERGN